MTQTNLLEKRKKSLEQKKNRLKQLESSINAQERKKRTRKLIEVGGLVAKAKLEEWNTNTLLEALLFLKEKESDKGQMDAWAHIGGAAFSAEKDQSITKRKREKQGAPVIVKFQSQPDENTRQILKSLGLKWNSLRQEWEGYTVAEELRLLLEGHEVTIIEID